MTIDTTAKTPVQNQTTTGVLHMSQSELTKMALALGMLYAVYKFVPHPAAKAAALGVAGIVVAKKIPVLQDQI